VNASTDESSDEEEVRNQKRTGGQLIKSGAKDIKQGVSKLSREAARKLAKYAPCKDVARAVLEAVGKVGHVVITGGQVVVSKVRDTKRQVKEGAARIMEKQVRKVHTKSGRVLSSMKAKSWTRVKPKRVTSEPVRGVTSEPARKSSSKKKWWKAPRWQKYEG